ncbi:MAG: hypothetical protein Q9191_002903, partial [Dirinaria sp. TL-2023a]
QHLRERAFGAWREFLEQGSVELELAGNGGVYGVRGGSRFRGLGDGLDDSFGKGLVVERGGGVDEQNAGDGIFVFKQEMRGVEGDHTAERPA